jgi:hypothetical protein
MVKRCGVLNRGAGAEHGTVVTANAGGVLGAFDFGLYGAENLADRQKAGPDFPLFCVNYFTEQIGSTQNNLLAPS